jgi:hypothetical protein
MPRRLGFDLTLEVRTLITSTPNAVSMAFLISNLWALSSTRKVYLPAAMSA